MAAHKERPDLDKIMINLLDFAFFEFYVLARNRVIFFKDEFFRHCTGVLLRHIEKACIRSRIEAYLHGCWFGHRALPSAEVNSKRARKIRIARWKSRSRGASVIQMGADPRLRHAYG